MAFYHWLGPAVKGWTSGKKEKEEHDLESSLKRIKMQQLADSMMMDKTRFGQEQKGWATEDAENARKLRRLADGGYLDQLDQSALETSLLEKDDKKFHNGRNQTEANQADSQFEDEETKRLYEIMSKKAEGENAAERERLELLKLQKEINNIGAIRTGTGTPKVPALKVPERFKAMQRELDSINKTIAMTGGADAYVKKFPGMRRYFKGKEGAEEQKGMFSNTPAVASTLNFDIPGYLKARNMPDYLSPDEISSARDNVDKDAELAATMIAEPPEATHIGNGTQPKPAQAPSPALSVDPAKMQFGPRGVFRTISNGVNGGIYDVLSEVQALEAQGKLSPLAAQQYWLQVRNNLYDYTTNANSEDIAVRLLQMLESKMKK